MATAADPRIAGRVAFAYPDFIRYELARFFIVLALEMQSVAEEHFPNAVAWNSSIFQGATILGPAAGGIIYAFFRGPATVYASAMLAACAAMFSTLQIYPKRRPPAREPVAWDTVLAGFRYVGRQ